MTLLFRCTFRHDIQKLSLEQNQNCHDNQITLRDQYINMEALAAVGLASSILQFVTFSTDLLSTSKEIYSSVEGSTKKIDDLNEICQCMDKLTLALTPEQSPESLEQLGPDERPSADDIGLVRLSNRCRKTSLEIKKSLASLKLGETPSLGETPPKRSKTQSLKLGIKLTLGKHVERLQETLDKQRNDLMLYLQVVSQQDNSAIMKLIDELKQANLGMIPEHEEKLDKIITLVETLRTETGVMLQRAGNQNDSTLKSIAESLEAMAAASSRDWKLESEMVCSLHFDMLHVRHTAIHDAHKDTFEWLLEPRGHKRHSDDTEMPDVNLLEWLQSGSGIYWVSGKPGCGKSTLMKLVADHWRTQEALDEWARGPRRPSERGDSRKCITAAYYFWSAGTQLQKSIEGLLRTLLFDILKQAPHLTPAAFPKRWAAMGTANRSRIRILEKTEWKSWTLRELTEALRLLTRASPPASGQAATKRFCFFIDGLDEFHGDHRELVNILCEMASFSGTDSTIKLCVSSRPWNVFEDTLGNSAASQKLYVHELTRGDIMAYTKGKLCSDRNSNFTERDKLKYDQLVNEITGRAQGVFLWVVLVVNSLLEGLSNGDSLNMLKKRVNDMPQELGSFFRHILSSVPPGYHRHMAMYFRVVLDIYFNFSAPMPSDGRPDSVTLMHLSFLDDQLDSQDHKSIRLPTQPLNDDDISSRLELMDRRIKARCKGLLEVRRINNTSVLENRVDFLHRTVYDFLSTPEMAASLDDLIGSAPVELLMLKACVSFYKNLPDHANPGVTDRDLPGHANPAFTDTSLLKHAMYYAHQADRRATLNAEGEVLSAAQIESEDAICQAVDDLRTKASARYLDKPPHIFDFPRMAAEFGVCGYISANIDAGSDGFSDIQSLLDVVLSEVGRSSPEYINFLNTISMLLRKSQLQAQPISVGSGRWHYVLANFAKYHKLDHSFEHVSYHKQVIGLIIPHVVDVNAYDEAVGANSTVPWGPLIACLLKDTQKGCSRGQSDTCMQILAALFSRGADPNGNYLPEMNGLTLFYNYSKEDNGFDMRGTIWSNFCYGICKNGNRDKFDGVGLNFLASVTMMLLKAGADTEAYPLPREAVRAFFPPRLAGQICKFLSVHQADTNQADICQADIYQADTSRADTSQAAIS